MTEESKSTAIVDWNALFADSAKQQAAAEKPSAKFISFKSGVLSYDDQAAPGNKIKCIVIGACYENNYFAYKFDPKKVRNADCWAVGFEEKSLVPGETFQGKKELTDEQNPTCEGCPQNEWESADEGKGKACKNSRRLAIVIPPATAEADVLFARLPVTSVKNWGKYVTQITSVVKRPTWAVVTELSVVPDKVSQFKVQFSFLGTLPEDQLPGAHSLYNRLVEEKQMLFGYEKNSEEPAAAAAPAAAQAKGKKF